jgi:hypothetical protein
MIWFGGPTYTFLKHLSTDKIVEDLASIYIRLVDLGMEYRNGQVCLDDLGETRNDSLP